MIAGRLPFAGERQEAVLYGITSEEAGHLGDRSGWKGVGADNAVQAWSGVTEMGPVSLK